MLPIQTINRKTSIVYRRDLRQERRFSLLLRFISAYKQIRLATSRGEPHTNHIINNTKTNNQSGCGI